MRDKRIHDIILYIQVVVPTVHVEQGLSKARDSNDSVSSQADGCSALSAQASGFRKCQMQGLAWPGFGPGRGFWVIRIIQLVYGVR